MDQAAHHRVLTHAGDHYPAACGSDGMWWLKASVPVSPVVGVPRRAGSRALRHHPWVMVWTIAVAQVISLGTPTTGPSTVRKPWRRWRRRSGLPRVIRR